MEIRWYVNRAFPRALFHVVHVARYSRGYLRGAAGGWKREGVSAERGRENFWRVARGGRIDSSPKSRCSAGTGNGFQPPPSPSLARSLARFESSFSFDNGGLQRDTCPACPSAYAALIVCMRAHICKCSRMRMTVSARARVCVHARMHVCSVPS